MARQRREAVEATEADRLVVSAETSCNRSLYGDVSGAGDEKRFDGQKWLPFPCGDDPAGWCATAPGAAFCYLVALRDLVE